MCDFVSPYIDTWCKNLNEAGNYNFNYVSRTKLNNHYYQIHLYFQKSLLYILSASISQVQLSVSVNNNLALLP